MNKGLNKCIVRAAQTQDQWIYGACDRAWGGVAYAGIAGGRVVASDVKMRSEADATTVASCAVGACRLTSSSLAELMEL